MTSVFYSLEFVSNLVCYISISLTLLLNFAISKRTISAEIKTGVDRGVERVKAVRNFGGSVTSEIETGITIVVNGFEPNRGCPGEENRLAARKLVVFTSWKITQLVGELGEKAGEE